MGPKKLVLGTPRAARRVDERRVDPDEAARAREHAERVRERELAAAVLVREAGAQLRGDRARDLVGDRAVRGGAEEDPARACELGLR